MSWKSLLPLGLIAFVIGLLVFLPARVATTWLEANTQGISLRGVRGTLFDGSARYLVASQTVIEDLHWNLQPAALLTGRIAARVQFDTDLGGITGNAAYTFWGTAQLSDVRGSASLGWVAERAGYTFLPVTGRVTLSMEHVALNDQFMPVAVDGRLRLANVYWQLMRPPVRLGSFSVRLAQSQDRVQLNLTDSSGPLAIKGGASYSPANARYRVDVRLRARAGAGDRLENMLNVLGRPNDGGWYHIQQQGRL